KGSLTHCGCQSGRKPDVVLAHTSGLRSDARQTTLTVFPLVAKLARLYSRPAEGSRRFMNVDQTIEVPLCDIQASYRALRASIDAAVSRVLTTGQVILGPEVAALEREVAAYCGSAHAVGCASGSDALLLALSALGVGP